MPPKLLDGTIVSGGVITGDVRVVRDPRDAINVLPGEIMVVPCSHPEFAIGVMQAAGLVCEQGGIISHICTVALELGIPCITEVKGAMKALEAESRVTLDGDTGTIYAA
jgi:phosphohistidine swiveling domain-containing protein